MSSIAKIPAWVILAIFVFAMISYPLADWVDDNAKRVVGIIAFMALMLVWIGWPLSVSMEMKRTKGQKVELLKETAIPVTAFAFVTLRVVLVSFEQDHGVLNALAALTFMFALWSIATTINGATANETSYLDNLLMFLGLYFLMFGAFFVQAKRDSVLAR